MTLEDPTDPQFVLLDSFRTRRAPDARRICQLRQVKCLAEWMRYFRLSSRVAGILLGDYHPNGRHGIPYSKSHITHVRSGDRLLTPDALRALAEVTNAIVERQTNGAFRVKMKFKDREAWETTIFKRCARCPRYFILRRVNLKVCPRCR